MSELTPDEVFGLLLTTGVIYAIAFMFALAVNLLSR